MRDLDDTAWLNLLIRSINERRIEGVEFPGFPSAALQAEFVGSANEATLREAAAFYRLVKEMARKLGNPLTTQTRFLDFGCGWGRFLRFFWKDIAAENLFGCDVDKNVVELCGALGIPGRIDLIEPHGSLPYADASFDSMMAYSVFTHLPEEQHIHWMHELARVARPGCVFSLTLEPRRFIKFISGIPDDTDVAWYRMLARHKPRVAEFYRSFDGGDLVFMPTNPGVEDTYGDAVVPISFVKERWAPYFKVIKYTEDPRRFWERSKFWQAVLVVQRV
jgi:SAM-dependent methyltransferase